MTTPIPHERSAPRVVVVMPAYRSAHKIRAVLDAIPEFVDRIIVVDDASPDDVAAVVRAHPDPRIELTVHVVNGGVGAAMKSGFRRAAEISADIVVKLDSDGQMDPGRIAELIAPLADGSADLAKGNRFFDLDWLSTMPLIRRLGNLGLSFMAKLASGYWSVFDPCNGYLAINGALLRRLRLTALADRYFFETSLLCEAYLARAVVQDVPIPPIYGDEISSLSPLRSLFEFLPRLIMRAFRRLGYSYFLRDFNLVSVFLCGGIPLILFGFLWSAYYWWKSVASGVPAHTGTIVIGAVTLLLGFQLVLQAIALDVQSEPGRAAGGRAR